MSHAHPIHHSCPNAYECGRLFSALAIMASMAVRSDDPRLKAMHRTFVFKAGIYGFDLKSERHKCRPAIRRDTVRTLIAEASALMKDMRRREVDDQEVAMTGT